MTKIHFVSPKSICLIMLIGGMVSPGSCANEQDTTVLSFMVNLSGPTMSPFDAATYWMSAQNLRLVQGVHAHNVQVVAANPKCKCEVVDQLVDVTLALEEVGILVIDIPGLV